MQRLKAFPAAVTNLAIRFFSYLLNKLKYLALHILKHPLGTIWWCIKMYFALMLLTLFVACSFGAMAQTQQYDPTDFKPAVLRQGYCAKAPPPLGGTTKTYACDKDQAGAVSKAAPAYAADLTGACATISGRSACSATVRSLLPPTGVPGGASFDLSYSEKCQKDMDPELEDCPKSFPDYRSISFQISMTPKSYACPPTDPSYPEAMNLILSKYIFGPYLVDNEERCYRPKPNSCFESDDFKLANQYHFDPLSQGKGKVCVKNDKAENCPWIELPGANGVFKPDVDNKEACELPPTPPPSTPAEKPRDPEKCSPGGNGMMVCKADPNEKCAVNSTGAMSCPDSCGYMNGEFMCFTEPDIPDDPNKPPKKPVPEPDDNITDPFKKMADMNKQDLKEIQRGVESRLEGFSASMENSMNELAAQGKNAEKAAGVGNKLLNSINQNTADTVKELKKLTGDESNPQPNYEETELGEKNDWQVRNFGTVMKAAADEILDKPMFQAIDGYFDVSFGGTCPTWNVSVWVFEVEINQFCDQGFQAILPLIRNVVILIFSILAFRVAFL